MKKILLTLIVIASAVITNAQYYYITGQGENPRNLHSDPEYPPGSGMAAGWTSIHPGSAVSPAWSAAQTIPFTFQFNAAPVTGYKVSTSGILTFETSAVTAPSYTKAALPNASIPDKSVCIWGLSGIASNDAIYTKTFGTAPNRQLWVHFSSYGYGSTASDGTNFTYWSIVLEETTNKIYIVDQRTGGYAGTSIVSAGIQINSTTATSVTGSPNLATKATTDATPADNYYYEFIQGSQAALDIAGIKVNMLPDLALPQAPFTIKIDVRNMGSSTITSGTINYSIDGGTPVSASISGLNIASLAFATLESPTKWTPTVSGTYLVKVWMSAPNGGVDGTLTNDEVTLSVKVWDNFVARKSLHEVFTSSTCPPCNPGNIQLQSVLDQRPGKFTVIKYQYYFPGIGDPYYTLEAYDRGTYYGGVNSIPRLFVDGQWNSNPSSYTTAIFDGYQTKPSFIEITASHTTTGQQVDMTANIKPLINFPAGTYKVRFAIVEKLTSQNIKTNGETEFHYVMKKMTPNATGVAFTMPAKDQTQTLNQSFTFPGSYRLPPSAMYSTSSAPTGTNYAGINLATENTVEEYSDLLGVVFVQDENTKQVLQSEFTTGFTGIKDEITLADLGLKLYPNPANTTFRVESENAASLTITVTDVTGKVVLVKSFGGAQEASIDCAGLQNGIYFAQINADGKTAVQKLIISK